jgi:hypothetical protein
MINARTTKLIRGNMSKGGLEGRSAVHGGDVYVAMRALQTRKTLHITAAQGDPRVPTPLNTTPAPTRLITVYLLSKFYKPDT